MKKFLSNLRKPQVILALIGSILGSVLSDAEVATSSSSSETPIETFGLLLLITSAIVLTIQIWSIWLKEKFIGKTKNLLRQIGGLSISAFIAIFVVAALGVQGQSIRLAIDSGEKVRYEASVKLAAEELAQLEAKEKDEAESVAQAAEEKARVIEEEQQRLEAEKKADEKAKQDIETQANQEESDKPVQSDLEKVEPFKDSKNTKNGGFTDKQIETIGLFSRLMKEYVNVYAGYVVGNETAAAVQYGCSALEESYSVSRQLSSTSPYFDDLLDRAKDYYYEAKSTCAYAFKKNRIDAIQESATYAATAKGFFDRILKEAK